MISDRLKQIIFGQLKLDDWTIEPATTADQVPGWDSLAHLKIITAVEQDFGIRFGGLEALRLRNVGDLQTLIDAKCAAT